MINGYKGATTDTETNITIPKDLKTELERIAKEQNRNFNNSVITVCKNFVSRIRKE